MYDLIKECINQECSIQIDSSTLTSVQGYILAVVGNVAKVEVMEGFGKNKRPNVHYINLRNVQMVVPIKKDKP